MSKVKKRKAEQAFLSRDFQKSFSMYSDMYTTNSSDRESKIGLLLSDFATEHEEEALALFDYYVVTKAQNQDAESIVEDIIKNFDGNSDKIVSLFSEIMSFDKNTIDGIMYDDFKLVVESKGDFKAAFEDLMFSTKVIFDQREDLIEFVDTLVDNGYEDMALSYLEDTAFTLSYDNRVQKIVEKLKLKD